MLLKLGVDISKLNRGPRRALNVMDEVYHYFGYEVVITSTYEANHSPSSLHYCNDAIDIRLPPDHIEKIIDLLKEKLGKDYDVVLESNHIHVEYDV